MEIKKDPYDVVKYPLSTEKSIGLIRENNSLIFVVDKKANKKDVKNAIENLLKTKVESVNTNLNIDGRKLAYVKFAVGVPAMDIATQLGIL